jgi:hypothetical protein
MAYTPPDPTALEFALTTPYTPPDPTALAFELGAQTVSFSVTGVAATVVVGDVTTIQRTDRTVNVTGEYAAAQLGTIQYVGISTSHNATGVLGTTHLGTVTLTGVNFPQTINHPFQNWGGTVSWIGTATLTNVDKFIDVTGVSATGVVGEEYAYGNIISAQGVDTLQLGRYYAGPNLQMIWDYGQDQFQLGNRTYVFDGSLSWVYGSEHSEIGSARLFNGTVRVDGLDHALVGTAFISNFIRTFIQAGQDFTQVGTAAIDNNLRVVFPDGEDFAVVAYDFSPPNPVTGRAPGVYLADDLAPVGNTGLEFAQFGTARLTLDVQHLHSCGLMSTARFGVATIYNA